RIRLVGLWDSTKPHWRKFLSLNREILKFIPPTTTRKPASIQDHRSRFESLWEESESVGDGVKEVKEGDRVAIPWMGYACGSCRYCVSGWETLCEQQVGTGYSVDGLGVASKDSRY